MTTAPSSTVVPPEIFQNIETLNSQVEKLQRELTQALEVWQNTLSEEKLRFETLLGHKEAAFQEQDAQWARQKEAFEERLAQIKSEFEVRLLQSEQSEHRALAELDDAWQRDKLEWGPAAQAQWPAERQGLEDKVRVLESEIVRLRQEHMAELAALPTPDAVKTLQGQLLDFQQTAASLQDQATHSDEVVRTSVQALDDQISVLYDLVQNAVASPAPTPSEEADLVQP